RSWPPPPAWRSDCCTCSARATSCRAREHRFGARLRYGSSMPTRTRSFGAGNRESHDATPFYERFTEPELSDDDTVNACRAADSIFCGDARDMQAVDECSVALVVTSPP